MREIALHLLDIAENSVAALAQTVILTIHEDLVTDRLEVAVEDDGRGMDAETAARVTDPFVTSRTTRKVGLGIPLFKAAAEACNGYLRVQSELGKGTRIETSFQHSHIDRMPLGNLADTMLTLLVANPGVRWILRYTVTLPEAPTEFTFDSQPIVAELGDIPLSEPDVLAFLRDYLEQGLAVVQEAGASTTLSMEAPGSLTAALPQK